MKSLADILNIANSAQQLKAGQISNESNQAVLTEQNALRNLVKDPAVLDAAGNVDPQKYALKAPGAAPTQGAAVATGNLRTQQAGIDNMRSQFGLTGDMHASIQQNMTALLQDPRVSSLANSQSPTREQLQAAADALDGAEYNAKTQGVPSIVSGAVTAPLRMSLAHSPQMLPQIIKNMVIAAQPGAQQTSTLNPNTSFVPTQAGTQPINTNSFAPGGIGPQGPALAPPNQIIQTPQGAPALASPVSGNVRGLSAGGGSAQVPVVAFPPGENADTAKPLQDQRAAANAVVQSIGERKNILREITHLADTGTLTGQLGGFVNQVKSKLGYPGESGSDYNTLGKMLEQEASRAAQAMGPHTNAGLESARAGNGTTGYDDKTIGKIARLTSANLTGAAEYSQGLEIAIAAQAQKAPGVDPIFVKRQFDQAWGKVYDPLITRFNNARESGDLKEQQEVLNSLKMKAEIRNGQIRLTSSPTSEFNTFLLKTRMMGQLAQGQI